MPFSAAQRNGWVRAGKAVPVVGGVVSAGTSAYDQWSRDSGRPDRSTNEKVARATVRSAVVTGASVGGALVGGGAGFLVGNVHRRPITGDSQPTAHTG